MINRYITRDLLRYHRIYRSVSTTTEFTKVYRIPKKLDDFGSYERQSFKDQITEEQLQLSPPLLALHSRLQLPQEYQLSTLLRCLICRNKQIENKIADNHGLSIFGKNLLTYYLTEYLLINYPRLPIEILNTAIHGYMGKYSLQDVARNWGIEEDQKDEIDQLLLDEPWEYSLGKLKYQPLTINPESGITELSAGGIDKASLFSHAVCSIIAGLFAHTNEQTTKRFIHNHIISRKLDILSMFEFTNPGRELSTLLKRENLPQPTARLIAETGRASNSPVFVVGVFSGDEKLGEGQGSSLREAKVRANVQLLKLYYLYRPLDPQLPSDDGFKLAFIDKGEIVI